MEPVPASTPWYRSMMVLTIATLVMPPLGLVLLWMRKDTETGKKVFATFAILALSASYLLFAYMRGIIVLPNPDADAHYAELERHRAAQHRPVVPVGRLRQ